MSDQLALVQSRLDAAGEMRLILEQQLTEATDSKEALDAKVQKLTQVG